MKKTVPGFVAVVAMLSIFGSNAQEATRNGQISASVENQDITLTQVESLSFGTLLPYGRAGSIYISPAGVTSGISALSTLPGAAGVWDVTGVNNAPYAVVMPSSVTLNSPEGNTMTVTNFNRTAGNAQLYLDAAGQATFNVGARLNVGANQPAGAYSGDYEVTVSYN